jgi:hypothetical protein
VSHATADKWLATVLCQKIEEMGAATFRDDRDINGGDNIPEKIRQEIIRSREIIVLVTPESVQRPWVLLEIGAAWGRRKDMRIIPILYHVTVDTIPDMLKPKKSVFLNDFNAYLDELRGRVRSALK